MLAQQLVSHLFFFLFFTGISFFLYIGSSSLSAILLCVYVCGHYLAFSGDGKGCLEWIRVVVMNKKCTTFLRGTEPGLGRNFDFLDAANQRIAPAPGHHQQNSARRCTTMLLHTSFAMSLSLSISFFLLSCFFSIYDPRKSSGLFTKYKLARPSSSHSSSTPTSQHHLSVLCF